MIIESLIQCYRFVTDLYMWAGGAGKREGNVSLPSALRWLLPVISVIGWKSLVCYLRFGSLLRYLLTDTFKTRYLFSGFVVILIPVEPVPLDVNVERVEGREGDWKKSNLIKHFSTFVISTLWAKCVLAMFKFLSLVSHLSSLGKICFMCTSAAQNLDSLCNVQTYLW